MFAFTWQHHGDDHDPDDAGPAAACEGTKEEQGRRDVWQGTRTVQKPTKLGIAASGTLLLFVFLDTPQTIGDTMRIP